MAVARRPEQFEVVQARGIERLYKKALVTLPWLREQLTTDSFAAAVRRSIEHYFRAPSSSAESSPEDLNSYLDSLHATDLALACACAAGSEPAWEHFILHFRPQLYAAARAVAGESFSRELADSLYAELYGLEEREGGRRSLFDYFHGRSKLSTWLRAVLAQRHLDAVRAARRTVSLDAHAADDPAPESSARGEALLSTARARSRTEESQCDPDRVRYLALLQATLTQVLAALDARERLRLSYYYVQELTLAEIGRLLGEHEATVSRKLERTRTHVRRQVEKDLREHKHLSEAQIRLCFDYARKEWPFDLTKVLSSAPAAK